MDYWRFGLFLLLVVVVAVNAGDVMKKSIVFDKKTPGVFYCPQYKPKGIDKMIVRARPLKKLCEFEGKAIPADYKPDCYDNVDESEYACKEKKRIMFKPLLLVLKGYKPDCYDVRNIIDDSSYAIKEEKYIVMRLHPPGSEDIKINNNNKWQKNQSNKNMKRKVKVRKQRLTKENY